VPCCIGQHQTWRLAHKRSIPSESAKNREDIKTETIDADYPSVLPSERGQRISHPSSVTRGMGQPSVLKSSKETRHFYRGSQICLGSPLSIMPDGTMSGLRPAADCRTRRTFLHLPYSGASRCGPAMLVTQDSRLPCSRQVAIGDKLPSAALESAGYALRRTPAQCRLTIPLPMIKTFSMSWQNLAKKGSSFCNGDFERCLALRTAPALVKSQH
jgi:hypothetical protein